MQQRFSEKMAAIIFQRPGASIVNSQTLNTRGPRSDHYLVGRNQLRTRREETAMIFDRLRAGGLRESSRLQVTLLRHHVLKMRRLVLSEKDFSIPGNIQPRHVPTKPSDFFDLLAVRTEPEK